MKNKAKYSLTMLGWLLLMVNYMSATTYYVKTTGNDSNAGTSWGSAFKTIAKALDAATSGDQIWVAAGTYYPDEGPGRTDGLRTLTFAPKNGVAVYGGFSGSETTLSQRNYTNNVTILSGDLNQNDTPNFGNRGDNAYTVVRSAGSGITNTAIFDGFTISGGNSGSGPGYSGYTQAGGGIYTYLTAPAFRNLIVTDNSAGSGGGAYFGEDSAPVVYNCQFIGNRSYAHSGGVTIEGSGSSPSLINCIIAGNQNTGPSGLTIQGAVYIGSAGSPNFTNCTITGNNALTAIFNYATPGVNFTNCIIWGNSSNSISRQSGGSFVFTNCLLPGNCPGGSSCSNVVNADPQFVASANPGSAPTTAFDLSLLVCSPAIDAGTNLGAPSDDIDGNPRSVNTYGTATTDIGAYENQTSGINPYTRTWTGTVNNDWDNPSNWNPNCVPDGTSKVTIPNVANDPVISNGTAGVAEDMEVQSGAVLTINSGASLDIAGAAAIGLTIYGEVDNNGTLNTANTGSFGIGLYSSGILNNAGILHVDGVGRYGVKINDSAVVTNTGDFNIGQLTGSINDAGLRVDNTSQFINDGGTVRIDNVIDVLGSFGDGIRMANSGFLENKNNGNIIIGQNGGVESIGIILFNTSILTNNQGNIEIDNTGNDAIQNKGTINNENGANLLIGQKGPIGRVGIFHVAGTVGFVNDASVIKIDNTTSQALVNQDFRNGVFYNNNGGKILIGQITPYSSIALYNRFESYFENNDCSEIHINGKFSNLDAESSFINNGLLSIDYKGSHANGGTFTNIGIIDYLDNGEIPNVTNNGIVVSPVSSECPTVADALEIGTGNTFNVLDEWFLEETLTNKAGDYNQAANEFTITNLPMSVASDVYFTATNGTCTFDLSTVITYTDTPPTAACQDYSVTLDASGQATMTAADIDNGSTDNCGGISLSASQTTFTCADEGDVIVTLTVTDGSGLSSTCNATVIIIGYAGASTRVWTGAVNTDWDEPGNWQNGCLPTASSEVTIPDVVNDPVIFASTNALAKDVEVQTGAVLTINSGGSLDISGSGGVGLDMSGTVNNSGIVNINNSGGYALDLNNSAVFNNYGALNIGQGTGTIGGEGLDVSETSHFNNDGGIVRIDNVASMMGLLGIGILTKNEANFDNKNNGKVYIGQNGGISRIGLLTFGNSHFTNDGAELHIDNIQSVSDGDAIQNQGYVINKNGGQILIGQVGSIGRTGIYNVGGYFENNNASLTIDGVGQGPYNIYNHSSASFTNENSGVIYLNSQHPAGNYRTIDNSGGSSFQNKDCSTLYAYGKFWNRSTFINEGLFINSSLYIHVNTGTFVNNGIVNYLTVKTIPDVTNNGIIVNPITTECPTVADALEIGTGNTFNVLDEWFLEETLTNKAGDYDQPNNEFTITNIAEGSSKGVYFTATNGTCTFDLSLPLTYDDTTPPTAVCQNFTAYLDATGNVTISGSDVDGDSFDNCDVASLTAAPNTFDCDDVDLPLPVTLIVTDVHGLTSSCTATVTVQDTVSPVAICQPFTLELDASGQGYVFPNDVDGGFDDACEVKFATMISDFSFDCSDIGTPQTVSVLVRDKYYNTSTCNSTVTVVDNVLPTAICKSYSLQLDNTGNADLSVSDIDGGSNDACGIASLSASPNTFTCAETGTNSVTLTVTDNNGNVGTCTATVTVNDFTGTGIRTWTGAVNTDWTEPGNWQYGCSPSSNDEVTIPDVANDPIVFDGTAAFAKKITVNAAAVLTIQANASLTVGGGSDNGFTVSGSVVNYGTVHIDDVTNRGLTVSENGSFDNNGGTVNVGQAVGNIGRNAIACYGSGARFINNSGTVRADNTGMVANHRGYALEMTDDGRFENLNGGVCYFGQNGGNGNIGIQMYTGSTFVNDASTVHIDHTGNLYPNTSDDISIVGSHFQNINGAQLLIGQDGGIGRYGMGVFDGGEFTNDGGTVKVDHVGNQSNNDIAIINYNAKITNTGSGEIIIGQLGGIALAGLENFLNSQFINDGATLKIDNAGQYGIRNKFGATFTNKNNGQVILGKGGGFSLAAFYNDLISSVFNEDCGEIHLYDNVHNEGTFTNFALLTVDQSDSHNNTGTFTNNGIINYLSGPEIPNVTNSALIVADATTECSPATDVLQIGGANTFTVLDEWFFNENLSGKAGDYNQAANTFNITGFAEGTAEQLYFTASDGTCTFDLSLHLSFDDLTPPTANCKAHTVQLDASGNGSLTANDIDNASFDNCAVASLSASPNAFDCSNIGTNMVTLTLTDIHGLTSTCTASVTVEDNTLPLPNCLNPTVQLGADGNYVLAQSDVLGNSSDNCSTVNFLSMAPTSVSCSNVGSPVSVTVTVYDASGNQSTCTATVTVEDGVPPTALCQPYTVQLDASGNGSISASDIDNGSSDACGIALLSASPNTFGCGDVGTNTVTLTVTDANGNTSTCASTVTVEDNVQPQAVCKNFTVELDASGAAAISASDINNGSSDACGIASKDLSESAFDCNGTGANSVTLTVTDGNGNSSTCNAIVTVVDNTPPVAVCNDLTVELDATGNYSVSPTQMNNGSSDVCGIQNLALSQNDFSCSYIGANSITMTVTDSSGNQSTCSATVTVEPFVVITGISTTTESCTGMMDGSLTISATTLGGTLMCSIDGGISFQANNTFNNLSPGSYSITVLAQGTSGCAASGSADIDAGPDMLTWYKDMDGDGYTDGATLSNCSQPAGYILNATPGDCDDYDADEHPGQIWYADMDNDDYGSGNTTTACQRPAGHFLASELFETDTDCDDAEAAVNPGATDICDGLDNNCDGQVDEGLSETYVGNVLFTSQAQLDAWPPCYDVIQGNVTIQGSNITDLSPLSNIAEITGNLMILTNTSLATLNGLENLSAVGGSFFMYYNFQLSDCCAINGLLENSGVAGSITIFFNAAGCNSQSEIIADCSGGNNLIALPGSIPTAESIEIQRMDIFPNPTNGRVNVQLHQPVESANLRLTDMQGRVLLQQNWEGGITSLRFSAAEFPSGLYLFELHTNGEVFIERLIIATD